MTDLNIRIDGYVYWLWAVYLLLFPIDWVGAAFLAVLIHELCHVCMIIFCGARIESFRIGPFGAALQTCGLMPWEEFLCALAGPVGSFLLLLAGRCFPQVAVCGFAQGLFNLLPVYPLDGGRVFRIVLKWIVPSYSENVEMFITILVVTASLVYSVLFARELFIIPVLLLIQSSVLRKRP